MPGDETETQPARRAGAGGPADRATSGPRHAAPRKSLLTKLHMPAGKAVALAAMPTAVLMGMGMTPHLAQADERSAGPFAAGPCVTRSATPTATDTAAGHGDGAKGEPDGAGSATPAATPTADPTGDGPQGAGDGTTADGAKGGTTGGKTGGTGTVRPDPTVSPAAPAKSADPVTKVLPKPPATTAPAPTPTPRRSTDPLDPLGLGDLLGGLLGGHKPGATPSATPTTPPATTPPPASTAPASSGTGSTVPPVKPSSGATKGSAGTGGGAVKGGVDGAAHTASKALKDLTAGAPSPAASPSASGTTDAGGSGGSGGKEPYPCPTYDAKALADAKTEGGIPLLPDQPWTLKSSLLTLYGLEYDGIVQVRTWSGNVKPVMKFTATGIDIGDLQQVVQGPDGTTTHVDAAPGSTSTIRNGTVTMYTESLSGNLLGLVPITFTPKAPPPLTLPVLFFTDATVVQAGQFGGDLHIRNMRVTPNQPAS